MGTSHQTSAKAPRRWAAEFRKTEGAIFARIVIKGESPGDVSSARQLLQEVCRKWPRDSKVQCLMTCAGFFCFDWPDGLRRQGEGQNLKQDPVKLLGSEVRRYCYALVESGLAERLTQLADYLIIGVDTRKEKSSEPHAEFVCVVDLRRKHVSHITAKSYPTGKQQKGLLKNHDWKNHFVRLNGTSTMLLVCHDLTIYNPRSDATAKNWRKTTKRKLKNMAKKRGPEWALQCPHTTVKKKTWSAAWAALREALPSLKYFAGAGRYSKEDRGWKDKDTLAEVLAATKSPNGVMDIVARRSAS